MRLAPKFPALALVALLQRAPMVRLAAVAENVFSSTPIAAILKSAIALASLGAVNSLAGATVVVPSRSSPISATVGTPIQTVVFGVTGSGVGVPGSWNIGGNIPTGLTLGGRTTAGETSESFPGLSGTPTAGGSFTFSLQAFEGANLTGNSTTVLSYTVNVTGSTPPPVSSFTTQPQSVDVHTGATLALSASVASPSGTTYQWLRNGTAIPGATSANLSIDNVSSADSGSYALRATNNGSSLTSNAASVSVASASASRLSNMSVRTNLASGGLLTVGFVTDGNKTMLVRAVGTGLVSIFPQFFTLSQVFTDPRISLFQGQTVIQSNDDWPLSLSTEFSRLGGFPLVDNSKDSALERTISGPHTAQVNGTGSGVLLVEVYDADSGGTTKLKNVSARNIVGTGADILIAGFVIDGSVGKTLLIRGNGPFLFDFFGIGNRITDPKLEIYTGAGQKIAENDDWSTALIPYFNQVGAGTPFTGSKDAALLISLPPGSYTAQLSGVNAVTGDGVVEVYEVE